MRSLLERFEKRVINGCRNPQPLITRYKLLKTRIGNLYVHRFHRSDEDRELHDHPWFFISLILVGGYVEETKTGKRMKVPGMILFRPARWAHRTELVGGRECWTLVWTFPRSREWGFHCDEGWKPHGDYHRAAGCLD